MTERINVDTAIPLCQLAQQQASKDAKGEGLSKNLSLSALFELDIYSRYNKEEAISELRQEIRRKGSIKLA